MAAAKSYVAIAALVMVPCTTGTTVAVYGGRPVPADITDEALTRLLAEEFIAEVGVPEDEVGGIQNDDPDAVRTARVRRTNAELGNAPAKGATKDAWVAYATAQGATDADTKTKDELVTEYGGS